MGKKKENKKSTKTKVEELKKEMGMDVEIDDTPFVVSYLLDDDEDEQPKAKKATSDKDKEKNAKSKKDEDKKKKSSDKDKEKKNKSKKDDKKKAKTDDSIPENESEYDKCIRLYGYAPDCLIGAECVREIVEILRGDAVA